MKEEDARKLKTMLQRYEFLSHDEVLRNQTLISILGFLDGYVSAILSNKQPPNLN